FNTADANSGGASGGDGGGVYNNSTLTFINTIIANNTDASAGHEAPDCLSNFTGSGNEMSSSGPNIVQNPVGCEILGDKTAVLNADPQFATTDVADNGGNTKTIALKPGSPAIDAGDDGTCRPNDQAGTTRPIGPHCDLGALEAPLPTPPSTGTGT